MADDPQARLAAEMARLRNAYLEHLPDELSALAALAKKLEAAPDRGMLEELQQRLHKLAGSGGTFGLAELSSEARRLEHLGKAWLGEEQPVEAALRLFSLDVAALPATLSKLDDPGMPPMNNDAPGKDDARSARLWLVHEEEKHGQELGRLLEQFGFEVSLYKDIAEAEAAAASGKPDALIVDIPNECHAMPDSPVFQGRPVLFISEQGDFAQRLRAVHMGAKGFLLKPLDVSKLVEQLEQIFEQTQQASYRVLIVDDDVALSEHYRLALSAAGMDVDVLSQPDKVIERVSEFHPDLVLMDIEMPDYKGTELAAVIRQHEGWVGLPIIYLSAETDVDEQIKAMGVGADDFLTKPISDARLVAAVKVHAERARRLADLMSKDSLTGLLKHARIKEALAIELTRSARSGKTLCVAMIDIDHFKRVNDTYGHAAGDRVIRAMAHLLKQRLRKSDLVGRYGGEEFVAVLPACDIDTAESVMNDIRERFARLMFHHKGSEFGCTFSVGIACNGQFPQSDLLVAADEALYCAKREGRNRVCAANP